MKPVKTFLLLMASFLLVACDSDEPNASGGSDPNAVERIGEGLEPGGHELTTEGSVQVIGAYGGDRGPTEFRPARRDGTNSEGPYTFRVRVMTERGGEEIMAYALLGIPAGSGPGTYELASIHRSGDNPTAMFRATAQEWAFARDTEGTLEIAELGEHLTAAFEYRAQDGDGDVVDVQGRVYRIPFEPQLEVQSEWDVNGESEKVSGQASLMSGTLVVGKLRHGVVFSLPENLSPGTYALSTGREEGTIRVTSTPINEDTVSGQMHVERDGDYFNGRFELTAHSDDEAFSASGEFQYLKLD